MSEMDDILRRESRRSVADPDRMSSMKLRDMQINARRRELKPRYPSGELQGKQTGAGEPTLDDFEVSNFFNDPDWDKLSVRHPRVVSGGDIIAEYDSEGNMAIRRDTHTPLETQEPEAFPELGANPFFVEDASDGVDPMVKVTNGLVYFAETGGSLDITNLGDAVTVADGDYVYLEWDVDGGLNEAEIKANSTRPAIATFDGGGNQLTSTHILAEIFDTDTTPDAAMWQGSNLLGTLRAVQRINSTLAIFDFLYDGKYAQVMFPFGV